LDFLVIHIQDLIKWLIIMSKEKRQVIGIDLEDLKDLIRNAVRDEIETCLTECRFGTEFSDGVWDRNKVAEFLLTTPEK